MEKNLLKQISHLSKSVNLYSVKNTSQHINPSTSHQIFPSVNSYFDKSLLRRAPIRRSFTIYIAPCPPEWISTRINLSTNYRRRRAANDETYFIFGFKNCYYYYVFCFYDFSIAFSSLRTTAQPRNARAAGRR